MWAGLVAGWGCLLLLQWGVVGSEEELICICLLFVFAVLHPPAPFYNVLYRFLVIVCGPFSFALGNSSCLALHSTNSRPPNS
jgi:hypothetical protein